MILITCYVILQIRNDITTLASYDRHGSDLEMISLP